jgi:hypothetical protein
MPTEFLSEEKDKDETRGVGEGEDNIKFSVKEIRWRGYDWFD